MSKQEIIQQYQSDILVTLHEAGKTITYSAAAEKFKEIMKWKEDELKKEDTKEDDGSNG